MASTDGVPSHLEPPHRTPEITHHVHVVGSDLPAPLQDHIYRCYEIAYQESRERRLRLPISATTDPYLNVTLSGTAIIRIGAGFRLPPVTLAGPQAAPYTAELEGLIHGFYIHFAPVGPLVLLGVEDYALTERGARPLHAMVRSDLAAPTRRWEQALLEASSFEERLERTTSFLLDCAAPPDRRARVLRAAIDRIEDAGGNLLIRDVAQHVGTSPSTLRRYFRALGMPPKRFASIVRFRRAHAFLTRTPGATWSEVVARFGYADQAHFVREYRRFSGTTPTQWDPKKRPVDRRMGIEDPPDD